ncbi:hypothetical protein OROGR_017147 [Orobanche gracilis]
MEKAQRWSVTYTNHVKQKRKVYHDGFLVLHSSRNKVTLYDESDKLLETRFVKKDGVIVCGETVTLDSYLVDLGEPCQAHQPTSVLNFQDKDDKVSETSSSCYSYNSQTQHFPAYCCMPNNLDFSVSRKVRKPMVGMRKGRGVNISPSQKMIRAQLGDCGRRQHLRFVQTPLMNKRCPYSALWLTLIPSWSYSLYVSGLAICANLSDFKKSEMNKFGSSPNFTDMTKLSTKEWQVLYTTQITQKAKKFHDGFLQLIVCGSQGRQVMPSNVRRNFCSICCLMRLLSQLDQISYQEFIEAAIELSFYLNEVKLYDTNRRHLNGRFLKKDEIVSSGESLVLDGHLVEIGEQEEDHKPPTDLKVQGRNCRVAEKSDMIDYHARISCNKKSPAGGTSQGALTKLSDSSYKTEHAKLSQGDAEPRRSVHDILSVLRQPSERKDNPVNKPFAQDSAELHSAKCQSNTKNHVKEYSIDCSGTARKELREEGPEHDSMIKVFKSEAVEVVIDAEERAVSENRRVSLARSSSFHPRPQTVNFISPIHDVQRTNINKLKSSLASMESHAAVTTALNSDIQKEIVSDSLIRSYENQELEIALNISSCEEVMTESNAALENASSSSELPELQENRNGSSSRCNNGCSSHDSPGLNERSLKRDLNTEDMDEYPSFDLGF